MNKIEDALGELNRARGIKGCALVMRDGMTVAECLGDRFRDDVVSGLVSFLISTTNRTLEGGKMGEFRRLALHSTHGKVLLIELGGPYLVVLLDQFANLESCQADVKAAAQHLRRLSKLPM